MSILIEKHVADYLRISRDKTVPICYFKINNMSVPERTLFYLIEYFSFPLFDNENTSGTFDASDDLLDMFVDNEILAKREHGYSRGRRFFEFKEEVSRLG